MAAHATVRHNEHYKHLNYQQFSQTTIDMADNTPDGSDNA